MSSFLDSLHADLREAIELTGISISVAAGQAVFKRGDAGTALYIIEKGSARVHDGDLVLNTIGQGDLFGEIAGLGGLERTASVTAEEDLTLLQVEHDDLYNALQTRPEALKNLVQMLCERESGMANRMTGRTMRMRAAEQELDIGRRIQAGFLPDTLPEIDGYEIAGHFQAARDVAGDFYDAFYIPAIDRLALVIGDVCDKGVGAALFMSLFRSLIRATAQSRTFMTWAVENDPAQSTLPDDQDRDLLVRETLANTVSLTNNYVATTHNKTSMFASVFIGLLDTKSGALSYINAGHEEAYIIGDSGIRLALPTTGPVLGIFAGVGHDIATSMLEPGETLLLYTDGVPEATDVSGKQYSEQRLRALLESSSGGAHELLITIRNSVNEFVQDAAQHDDITMLASKRQTV
jgi:sigma-B regulation protein RsbU (phosphoserine phosphatase)